MDIKANRGQAALATPSDQKTGFLPSFPAIEVRTMKQDLEALSKKGPFLPSAEPELKSEPVKSEAKPIAPPAPPRPPVPAGPSQEELLSREKKEREEEIEKQEEERIKREQEKEKARLEEERLERERERLQKEKEEKVRLEEARRLEEMKKKEEEVRRQQEQAKRARAEIEKPISAAPAKTVAPPAGLPTQAPPPAPAPSRPAPAVVSDFLTASEELPVKVSSGKKKAILFMLVLLAAFLSAGIWIFWLISAKPSPSTTPTPTAVPSYSPSPSPVLPTDFFRMDGQESIILKPGENLSQKIQDLATSTPAGNFIQLTILDGSQRELDLAGITSVLKLDLFDLPTQKCENPEQCAGIGYLKDDLDAANFSLFYYSQMNEGESSSPFIAEPDNHSRIGLIIALKDQSTSTAARLTRNLEQLESFMAASLQGLFMGKKTETPIPPAFQDNIYQGIKMRYMNLPDSELTIDYALVNGNLLFTTSKESMFVAIERCLQQSEGFLP